MKKKIFAVLTAVFMVMALIPTFAFAAEDTVKVNFTFNCDSSLDGWYFYDWDPNVDGQDFTALNASGNTATITVDVPVASLASYGGLIVDAAGWGGKQSDDIKLTGITANAGDTVDVTVKVTSNADGKWAVEVSAGGNSAPADPTPSTTTTTTTPSNVPTGVEGVTVAVVALAAAGMIVSAKKSKK